MQKQDWRSSYHEQRWLGMLPVGGRCLLVGRSEGRHLGHVHRQVVDVVGPGVIGLPAGVVHRPERLPDGAVALEP